MISTFNAALYVRNAILMQNYLLQPMILTLNVPFLVSNATIRKLCIKTLKDLKGVERTWKDLKVERT